MGGLSFNIHSLNTPESYSSGHKRRMRSVTLEPNFSKRGTGSFVCGGLARAQRDHITQRVLITNHVHRQTHRRSPC
ncbi:hypothetical protein BDM02DRAFT_715193 [Thelephora ganbajun]|uniref:Uncharacterized protein n=1 Tax=Thelephora ganbajun TaxID=370292 RepID=A0ACB6Z7C4_THEGA|nr:hypothetical protein BDM02DRAFT_715193 [Thelephora ganbajun]